MHKNIMILCILSIEICFLALLTLNLKLINIHGISNQSNGQMR